MEHSVRDAQYSLLEGGEVSSRRGSVTQKGKIHFDKDRWKNFRRDALTYKTCIIAFFAISCVYLNCVLQIYAQRRARVLGEMKFEYLLAHGTTNLTLEEFNEQRVLPDIGYDILPNLQFLGGKPADILVEVVLAVTVLRFLCVPQRMTIFRRTIFVYGLLFLIRGVSILVTLLPNPDAKCVSTVDDSQPFTEAFYLVLYLKVTCYDVLYSAHTVNLTIAALMWTYYPVSDKLIFKLLSSGFAWIVAIGGYFLIIATHFHYTIDVLLGSLLTLALYILYHDYVRHMKVNNELQRVYGREVTDIVGGMGKGMAFNPIIVWIESDLT